MDQSHASEPIQKKRSRSKSLVRARKRRLLQQRPSQECIFTRTLRPPSLFETYIKSQEYIHPNEYYDFFTTLRNPLPVCFRIRSPAASDEWERIRRSFSKQDAESVVRVPVDPNAYQIPSYLMDCHPTLRRWIATSTSNGQVSRQEYVSMIPVHLLHIQSHHRVLDLCASPGSKTVQALDALYASCVRGDADIPSGFVMANELDTKRAYVLAHRTREALQERMVSMAVVTHNACRFPNVLTPCKRVHTEQQTEKPFDRIICDVPCSGDGTLRKDIKVYKTWHPSYGMALHSLQLRIAKRGIALLKVGAYMTYSTCSFHPIENEAVVAALLSTGCVELVDAAELLGASGLNGLKYRKGLSLWKVLNDECTVIKREAKEWPDTLWPPEDEDIAQSLKKCIRMVPQDNDTGGFFIALLKKVQDFDCRSGCMVRSKEAMVTPQMPFHKLYESSELQSGTNDNCRYFVRSQRSTLSSKAKTFKLCPTLAEYLCDKQGSSKLNLVYAGHALPIPEE